MSRGNLCIIRHVKVSYLTSLGQEEREKHLLNFHLTYAQAHKPPAKKKTSIKQKANSGAESIVIKNKRGRKIITKRH